MKFLILCATLLSSSIFGETAEEEIKKSLIQWSHDFNENNVEATCSLFSKEVIVSYPGTLDKRYDKMCHQLRESMANKEKGFHYDEPYFEGILVKDDLAIVRLIWTLSLNVEGKREKFLEKGIDVFKKESDGKWRVLISYAYPIDYQ